MFVNDEKIGSLDSCLHVNKHEDVYKWEIEAKSMSCCHDSVCNKYQLSLTIYQSRPR